VTPGGTVMGLQGSKTFHETGKGTITLRANCHNEVISTATKSGVIKPFIYCYLYFYLYFLKSSFFFYKELLLVVVCFCNEVRGIPPNIFI
jgi:hypothetical protein